MEMALISIDGPSDVECEEIFFKKLRRHRFVFHFDLIEEERFFLTEIHRRIEQEPNRENSERIAQFLYHHRFSPPLDIRRNVDPINIVHEEFVDKQISHRSVEFQSNISKSVNPPMDWKKICKSLIEHLRNASRQF